MWTSLRISSAQEKEISNLAHAETPSKIGVCPKRHFQRSYDAYFNENDLKNLRRLIIPCWSHCIKWAKSPYTWPAMSSDFPLSKFHLIVRQDTSKNVTMEHACSTIISLDSTNKITHLRHITTVYDLSYCSTCHYDANDTSECHRS